MHELWQVQRGIIHQRLNSTESLIPTLAFLPCRSQVEPTRLFRRQWAPAGDPSVGIFWAFRKLANRLKTLRSVILAP